MKQESLKLIQDEFDSLDKCYLDKLISSHPFQDMSRQLNLLSEDFLELKQYLTQQIEDLRGPPNVPPFNDRRDFHNCQRASRPGFGSDNIAIELDRLRQAKSTAGDTYSNQQFMENNPMMFNMTVLRKNLLISIISIMVGALATLRKMFLETLMILPLNPQNILSSHGRVES